MKLRELAARLPGAVLSGDGETAITAVTHDSRKAGPGALFVAVKGLAADGNQFVEAHALNGLGSALRLGGRRAEALAAHRSALALARTLGDRYREARSLDHIAAVLCDDGAPDEARELWREALWRYGDLDAGRTAEVRARLAGLDG